MATTTQQPTAVPANAPVKPTNRGGLQVSTYEQTSGMLLACLVLFGLVAVVMTAAWFSTRLWIPRPPVAVQFGKAKDVGGGEDGQGTGEQPTGEEFVEPAASETFPAEPPLADPAAISLAAAQSEVLAEFSSSEFLGNGPGRSGNGRRRGPSGPGDEDGTPSWERWEVRMNSGTTDEYARQLDFFQIELGVAGGGNADVTYLSNLSAAKPSVRTGNPRDERRLRFMHRAGQLRDAERRLAAKAGVDTEGKVVVQFYSQDMYQKLLTLENEAMAPRRISEVRRTIFGVREIAGKYEFYVIEQQYR